MASLLLSMETPRKREKKRAGGRASPVWASSLLPSARRALLLQPALLNSLQRALRPCCSRPEPGPSDRWRLPGNGHEYGCACFWRWKGYRGVPCFGCAAEPKSLKRQRRKRQVAWGKSPCTRSALWETWSQGTEGETEGIAWLEFLSWGNKVDFLSRWNFVLSCVNSSFYLLML